MHLPSISWCFLSILLVQLLHIAHGSRVYELSDRFTEIQYEGQWFVMFYAPWCAHCKRTEPIWGHVAQGLVNTNIRVGKIDCSRFPKAATHFEVHNYPTIMFIKGTERHYYIGERVREDFISYALRMTGPSVQHVLNADSFEMLKNQNDLFYVYIGERNGTLHDSYLGAAAFYQQFSLFFTTPSNVGGQHFDVDISPAILVWKESHYYMFPPSRNFEQISQKALNDSLGKWVNEERFLAFPQVTRTTIYQISQTRKYLVLAVVDQNKLGEITSHELEFRDMIETVARQNYDRYHPRFQFGWLGQPDIAHSIVMDTLPTPHLVVLNTSSYEHYIPLDEPCRLTSDAVELFLNDIYNGKVKAYGGNSLAVRIYRTYFESARFMRELWRGNPILTMVLFGLPMGFLSLIMYSICCADILDASEEDEDDEVEHEKHE